MEGRIRKRLKLRGYDLVPAISFAEHLSRRGLEVRVIHNEGHRFWKWLGDTHPDLMPEMERRYEKARTARVVIDKKTDITEQILQRVLDGHTLVMCGIDLLNGIKHAILVYGYGDDKQFRCVDPLVGKITMPADELMKFMHTPTGAWCIIASDHGGHERCFLAQSSG